MSYKITAVSFSESFYRACKSIKTYDEVIERLKLNAKNQNLELNEIIYFFTKQSLEHNHFFDYSKEVQEKLYFDAAYWASKEESKQKTRPKNFKDIDNKNYTRVFTKFLASTMKSLYVKHNINSEDFINSKSMKVMAYNIEVEEYLNLLFEISCIKRDRSKKKWFIKPIWLLPLLQLNQ